MAGDRLLDTREAAAFLGGLAESTLVNWRVARRGPAFVKMGAGRRAGVRYRESILLAYLRSREVGTSDQPVGKSGSTA